ncbi:LysR family transcriptional regulator [Paludibacterium paludis]|uniref:LysR family transcriptional regulator n=1 Tax=Paludibacterium paludis TaxID=1225769 RepID=A0A918UAG0_9NEIS|nr:LysR family transcriptional regulator [Paludibacterium paludis]GGY17244.1 LysR family transcriptional regulator [Paludibacterium paludis]
MPPPSLDALQAFAEVAGRGSFTAAARALGKSQSTLSESVANLEIDLGVSLFDRSGRQPRLTSQGEALLSGARLVLDGVDRLRRQAAQLESGVEARLTLVLSDTYPSAELERIVGDFSGRFPALELECLFGEDDDVLHWVAEGRAHLGFVSARDTYPASFAHSRLDGESRIALYASRSHPLAALDSVGSTDLSAHRELRLGTYLQGAGRGRSGPSWSSPSYLLLLELARLGMGWAELPRWLVEHYGGGLLVELPVAGWPRPVQIDMVWSRLAIPGPAQSWWIERLAGPSRAVRPPL